MTKEKAISILDSLSNDVYASLSMAVDALKKQVPQTVERTETELICPQCCKRFHRVSEIDANYCANCGQKLNWYWGDE